jgi:hypothetical protein
MALSWNEIKYRAISFSNEWAGTSNEEAEAKSFIEAFFEVFGISRRRVATFEHRVKKLDEHDGYIDLLWKGNILIEMKSRGKNLDKAFEQAKDYTYGLKQYELPNYILVSDFENFRLYDLENNKETHFLLKDFVSNIQLFGFIAGYQKRVFNEEDPVNIKAAYLMGKLHDALKDAGYAGHELEKYLVRLLFCLFADDTTIFEAGIFQEYILNKTHEDGTDLGLHLAQIFQILNSPNDKRQKTLDESLNAFPYINGQLFEEQLSFASFNTKMRNTLLECCVLDWSKISPAIFGSMFQSVMNPVERRNLGAHYTSEKNILKLIKPLFLDDLWKEYETVKNNHAKLKDFQKEIANLRFLDPACGCGNFLIISYREIRLLEIEIIKQRLFYHMKLRKEVAAEADINIKQIVMCDVDMFYGMEYEEFPAQIAQLAMWLIDHQMNQIISSEFGKYFARIPLKKAANIVHGNALQMNWENLIARNTINIIAENTTVIVEEPETEYKTITIQTNNLTIIDERNKEPILIDVKNTFDFIIGNPPFIGKQMKTDSQKADMEKVFAGYKGVGVLDYVTAWYLKAAKLIQGTNTKVAFVSTNSIVQGEQAGLLWNILFNQYNIKIHFAHQTFKWNNEARGNAAVHCVIVGFANFDTNNKSIFEYEDSKGDAKEIKVKNISPYLTDGNDVILLKRSSNICKMPVMNYGSMPNDGGFLLLNEAEKEEIISKQPLSEKYIRKFVMGEELINSIPRYCIWIDDYSPNELKNATLILERINKVKNNRLSSNRQTTRELSSMPYRFGEVRQPKENYIAFPRVSSQSRKYIPITILDKSTIAGDKVYTIETGGLYHFGVLMSEMHMVWMRLTCGRMKSDYSYSNTITYNNFPWPLNPNEKQINAIETAAQKVLDARAEYPESSLADLYGSLMPPILVKAHNELDKAVDLAYRPQVFANDTKRIAFLFELYERYTAGIFIKEKKQKSKK